MVETRRPVAIPWQQHIGWHSEIRVQPLALTELIHSRQAGIRPVQRLAKLRDRPTPELIRTNVQFTRQTTQGCHPDSTNAWTAAPQPPPTPHEQLVHQY